MPERDSATPGLRPHSGGPAKIAADPLKGQRAKCYRATVSAGRGTALHSRASGGNRSRVKGPTGQQATGLRTRPGSLAPPAAKAPALDRPTGQRASRQSFPGRRNPPCRNTAHGRLGKRLVLRACFPAALWPRFLSLGNSWPQVLRILGDVLAGAGTGLRRRRLFGESPGHMATYPPRQALQVLGSAPSCQPHQRRRVTRVPAPRATATRPAVPRPLPGEDHSPKRRGRTRALRCLAVTNRLLIRPNREGARRGAQAPRKTSLRDPPRLFLHLARGAGPWWF